MAKSSSVKTILPHSLSYQLGRVSEAGRHRAWGLTPPDRPRSLKWKLVKNGRESPEVPSTPCQVTHSLWRRI